MSNGYPTIKVCSHRRSGTHFLMASLHHNFLLGNQAGCIRVQGQRWAETGEESARIPWCNLFGAHGPISEADKKNIPRDRILYIVRHPYDCLYSLWRFWGERGGVDAFISADRIERWREHVASYTAAGVYVVRYEDLHDSFAVRLSLIGEAFDLTLQRPGQPPEPPAGLVGWTPREGRVGYYHNATPDTVERVKLGVGPLGVQLGYWS